MSEEQEVITEPTSARALIHLYDTPFEPIEVLVRFCGVSFEHLAQVLMGDAHPKQVGFVVFDRITPQFRDKAGVVVSYDVCQQLTPIFLFGHELIHL